MLFWQRYDEHGKAVSGGRLESVAWCEKMLSTLSPKDTEDGEKAHVAGRAKPIKRRASPERLVTRAEFDIANRW
jgi:hypothetical protein